MAYISAFEERRREVPKYSLDREGIESISGYVNEFYEVTLWYLYCGNCGSLKLNFLPHNRFMLFGLNVIIFLFATIFITALIFGTLYFFVVDSAQKYKVIGGIAAITLLLYIFIRIKARVTKHRLLCMNCGHKFDVDDNEDNFFHGKFPREAHLKDNFLVWLPSETQSEYTTLPALSD